VRDVTEVLVELPEPPMPITPAPAMRVAYHDPCHLAHAQGIRVEPRRLLARVPGVMVVPMEDETCAAVAPVTTT